MNKKALIRWIIGPTKINGFKCLKQSVEKIKQLYPEFDLLICHNQLNEDQINFVKNLNVELFDQSQSINYLCISPESGYQVHWKLYPARMALNKHEIILDNDIVLFKRLREIDEFLESDSTLMCQGINLLHGKFGKYVPTGIRVNSGLFGMPPNFDFYKIMKENIKDYDLLSWENRFDEQGLVASVLNKHKNKIFISLINLPIIESNFDLQSITTNACCGYHFVGLNYQDVHNGWENYIMKIKKIIL